MRNALYFDRIFDNEGNMKGFSFLLDEEEKRVSYSSVCEEFIFSIKNRINSTSAGFVSIETGSNRFEEFLLMVVEMLGLKCTSVWTDMKIFKIPEGLTVEKVDELLSYEGISEYLHKKGSSENKSEVSVTEKSEVGNKGCPLCKGEELRAHEGRVIVVLKGTSISIRVNSVKVGFKIAYCPVCGRKLVEVKDTAE